MYINVYLGNPRFQVAKVIYMAFYNEQVSILYISPRGFKEQTKYLFIGFHFM